MPPAATALRTIENAHDVLGLPYREIAAALRANESTLHRWRAGGEPSPVFLQRLESLEEFLRELRRTFRDMKLARQWLDAAVPALRGQTPREALLAGRVDMLTGVLYALNSGGTA